MVVWGEWRARGGIGQPYFMDDELWMDGAWFEENGGPVVEFTNLILLMKRCGWMVVWGEWRTGGGIHQPYFIDEEMWMDGGLRRMEGRRWNSPTLFYWWEDVDGWWFEENGGLEVEFINHIWKIVRSGWLRTGWKWRARDGIHPPYFMDNEMWMNVDWRRVDDWRSNSPTLWYFMCDEIWYNEDWRRNAPILHYLMCYKICLDKDRRKMEFGS